MYHQIVANQVKTGFDHVSNANFEALLSQCTPDVVHHFAGEHALGGERHDVQALRLWFQRIGRLLPNFKLEITRLVVHGMPWNTLAIVQWTGRATLVNGCKYVQHGVHFVGIKWGRVHSFRVYVDTQELAHTLEELGRYGVSEAIAAPIVS
jgi:ketosteroid isomerase-like protein